MFKIRVLFIHTENATTSSILVSKPVTTQKINSYIDSLLSL